jgi:hypothetical protein
MARGILDIDWNSSMSDWKKITVADVEMLSVNYRQRITESYLDDYKHMNVILS